MISRSTYQSTKLYVFDLFCDVGYPPWEVSESSAGGHARDDLSDAISRRPVLIFMLFFASNANSTEDG